MGEGFWVTDLQHCLLLLIIVQVSRGQADERPLHAVLLRAVEVGMWPPHYNVTFDPSVGVRLQNMDVTLLGNDGAAEQKTKVVQPGLLNVQQSSPVSSPDSDLLDVRDKPSCTVSRFSGEPGLRLLQ